MTVTRRSEATEAGDITVIDVVLPRMRVQLLSLGAAIREVDVPDSAGRLGGVHLALPTVADHATRSLNPHLGVTLGRYANRIAGGSLTLDGTTYDLDVNNGPHTLHGGSAGWDRFAWEIEDATDRAGEATLTFAFTSPDGDMGFPGRVEARATYTISDGHIEMRYEATTDAPTVISMANHGYWNLDGSSSIAGHRLEVLAQRRLEMDDTNIPRGIVDVAGTPYDLRRLTALGPVIEATGGLDDCYLPEADGLRVMARLHGATSGRAMTVSSDAPGLQVYTGNHLHAPFQVHQSVSLEAQRLPDAPHQPALGPCVLLPGERYATTTLLEFANDAREE